MNKLITQNFHVIIDSREIAKVTGKRPGDVIRDIRDMAESLKDDADLRHQLNQGLTEHKDKRGYTSHFELDRFAAELLVTGYDIARRARVLNKLVELSQRLALEEQRKRDRLTPLQTAAVAKLQRLNTSLIEIGMSYKERKQRLYDYFMAHLNDELVAEVLRLEA